MARTSGSPYCTDMDLLGTSRNTLWASFLMIYLWVHALFIYSLQDPSAPRGEVKSQKSKVKNQKSKVLNPLATNETSTFFGFG